MTLPRLTGPRVALLPVPHALAVAVLAHAPLTEPVTALCGKVWTPGRDPEKFPVCPVCKEIYQGLRAPQDGQD